MWRIVFIIIIIITIIIIIIIIIGTWAKKWVFSYECSTFWDMMSDIGIDKK